MLLILNVLYSRLAHLPQFKEKSASLKEVPLGLLIYPVLQAADILLYKLVFYQYILTVSRYILTDFKGNSCSCWR